MRLLAIVLLGLTVLPACAPSGVAAPAPHGSYRGPLASSLQVEMLGGDSVRLVLQVSNATDRPVAVTFSSGQSYDFQVSDGGETVWSWSADRSFMQAVRNETLAPGETRSHAETWHAPAALRGRTLTALGRFTSSDHPLEHTARFQLP